MSESRKWQILYIEGNLVFHEGGRVLVENRFRSVFMAAGAGTYMEKGLFIDGTRHVSQGQIMEGCVCHARELEIYSVKGHLITIIMPWKDNYGIALDGRMEEGKNSTWPPC